MKLSSHKALRRSGRACGQLLLAGLWLLATHAALAQPSSGPTVPSTPLQYMAWVQAASIMDIQAERTRLANDASSDPLVTAVQLGLLLSVSSLASPATEQEALARLADVQDRQSSAAPSADYRIFAGFLQQHLQQREALRRADASQQELETLRQDNTLLQDKIRALTTLEEQLVEREQVKEQEQALEQTLPPATQQESEF